MSGLFFYLIAPVTQLVAATDQTNACLTCLEFQGSVKDLWFSHRDVKMNRLQKVFAAGLVAFCFEGAAAEPAQPLPKEQRSQIVSQAEAEVEKGEGYQFYSYFTQPTFGTAEALTGVAVIEPGQEIHPPHTHAGEEFLMVIEGEGVWSLNDKEAAAKAGDILYAAPWDSHGIRNTGKTLLKFVVMKWQSKGVAAPAEPVASVQP
jgi:mannose-6-phosphate isomerase-like protein (cupin superfamily)